MAYEKIKYQKGAQKHVAARKLKRDLKKLIAKYPNIEFFFDITGLERWDYNSLLYREEWLYRGLIKDINESLEVNKKIYDGFYYSRHEQTIAFIKELSVIRSYVFTNYCQYETKPQSPNEKKS
jgi:hypothetical protein